MIGLVDWCWVLHFPVLFFSICQAIGSQDRVPKWPKLYPVAKC